MDSVTIGQVIRGEQGHRRILTHAVPQHRNGEGSQTRTETSGRSGHTEGQPLRLSPTTGWVRSARRLALDGLVRCQSSTA